MLGGEKVDRFAWVTGGASGIGLATVARLSDAGLGVRILDRDIASARRISQTIVDKGGRCDAVEIDLSMLETIDSIAEGILQKDGRVDVLVNAAGMARRKLLGETSRAEWDEVVNVNMTAPFLLCRAAARAMTSGFGRIVNVSSHSALFGSVGRGSYAAAKAGMVGMTRVLAIELAGRGVTVNAVAPGPIETAMTSGHGDKQRQVWNDAVPLGRYGTADEVAAAIVFLASPDASYITGQVLSVDGGFSAAGLLS